MQGGLAHLAVRPNHHDVRNPADSIVGVQNVLGQQLVASRVQTIP